MLFVVQLRVVGCVVLFAGSCALFVVRCVSFIVSCVLVFGVRCVLCHG